MKWIEEKICNLYEYGSGLSISSNNIGTGFPFLSFTTIFNNYIVPDELNDFVESTEKDRINCSIKEGDVFLTRTSETVEELAMSSVAIRDYPNATFNGFTKRLRPINDKIFPLYAAYFFRSPYFRKQAISMSSLITRASLNISMMDHFIIRYPEKKLLQEKIGKTLYNYDMEIKNNNKRIEILNQIAEEIYKEWFVRFRFPGYQNTKFENGIPSSFKLIKIKNITALKSGYAFKSTEFVENGKACVAKIKDINDGIMDISNLSYVSNEKTIKKANKFILNYGDLTIALTGATIGKIGIVPKCNKEIYTNQRLGKFFNGENPIIRLPYLYVLFSQESIRQMIYNVSGASSAQPNISPEQIENLKIITNIELIEKYNRKCYPIFEEILKLDEINKNLIKQRDLLLPRLMSGKLEVK